MQVRRIESRFVSMVAESPEDEAVYGMRVGSARLVADLLGPVLANEAQEVFAVLLLDGRHKAMGYVEVSRGTMTSSLVHPREVFGPALRMGAVALVLAHNHPSGDAEPSTEDRNVTRRLAEAGALLGVPVLDHVVVATGGEYASIREQSPRLFEVDESEIPFVVRDQYRD